MCCWYTQTTVFQVKVLDFGLASTPERVEEDDNVVGTLGYMAPEIILSEPYTKPPTCTRSA